MKKSFNGARRARSAAFTLAAMIVLSAIFSITLAGCAPSESARKATFWAMNGPAELTVYADFSDERNSQTFEKLEREAGEFIKKAESSLDVNVEGSYISAFNALPAGGETEIDQITYGAVLAAFDAMEKSGGSYNPAVYYAVRAFGFGAQNQKPQSEDELPSKQETDAYAALASAFSSLSAADVVREEGGRYYAKKPLTTVKIGGGEEELSIKIDLGGISKGYVADGVNAMLKASGFTRAMFWFSSSSIAFGEFSGGGEFKLNCVNPRDESAVYAQIRLKNTCVSTSGDYGEGNFYEFSGQRYCHLIDPRTCRPITSGIMSAIVLGDSAALNDALSTAVCAMDVQSAKEFIKTQGLAAMFVYSDDGGNGGADGNGGNGGSYKVFTSLAEGAFTLAGGFIRVD